MNMISTGAFQTEMDASGKQDELVTKLVNAWEKKNSKVARAGGLSLMALSLAACGSDDDTPFSQVDVDAAKAAATTAALTGADGTVHASVDVAVTSNDTTIASAATATAEAAAAVTLAAANDATAVAEAATAALQTTHDALVTSNAALQASYDALVAPTSGALTTSVEALNGTTGNDSFTAAAGNMQAGDVVSDPSTTDADTLTAAFTADGDMGTVVNIEAVTVNVAALTTAGTAGSFESDMGSVIGSNVTVNLTQAGGIVDAIVSDLGTGSSVTAGTRVEDLTVDFSGAVSNVSVTGGTAVTTVNGTASKVTGMTVDGSAGTNLDVEFGALSSDVTVTTGTGTTDINNGAGARVTNLVVDAAKSTGTIDIDTISGSTVTLTATDLAGAISLVSTNVAGTSDTATITASAADLGVAVDGFETINVNFLDEAAATMGLDAAVTSLTANTSGTTLAATAAITIDANTVASALGTVALNGSNGSILQLDAREYDGTTKIITATTDTADVHTISFETAHAAVMDLTGIANGIDINLGVAMAANVITVANGASITSDTVQTAAVAIKGESADSAVSLDLTAVNHTGTHNFTNVGTLTISNSADMATVETVTVDSNTTGTQGAIVLSGTKDIDLAGATDASAITSNAFSGDLTATLSATIDGITSGSGNDSVTAYDGNWSFDGGAGDDTLTLTGDHSDDTVSFSNVEILQIAGATVVFTAAQVTGTTAVVTASGAGTITLNGTAAADTVDLSGISTAASILVTEFDIDAGAGDDAITLGNGKFTVEYTTGADGNDTIVGFTTTEDNYDTNFGIANGAAAVVTVTTAAAVALNTTADDVFSFTVDSFSDTSEAGVIAAISNGEITVSAASHDGIILINDGTASHLFEFTASANNTTLTATDDTITHVATFTDEVIVAADIV